MPGRKKTKKPEGGNGMKVLDTMLIHQADSAAIKVAKGAAGVAAAASMVAVGAILSDKQTRSRIGENIRTGAKKFGEAADYSLKEMSERYQTVSHRVNAPKKTGTAAKAASQKGRGRSKSA